jgi:hypothetical protein
LLGDIELKWGQMTKKNMPLETMGNMADAYGFSSVLSDQTLRT